jgi:hypothetical protein
MQVVIVLKFLGLVSLVHVIIWSIEFTYYKNCSSGLFNSLYTHQSSVCKTLRSLSVSLDSSLSSGMIYATFAVSNLLSKVFGPNLFLGDKRPEAVAETRCDKNPSENQSLSDLTGQNFELRQSDCTLLKPETP